MNPVKPVNPRIPAMTPPIMDINVRLHMWKKEKKRGLGLKPEPNNNTFQDMLKDCLLEERYFTCAF